MLRSLPASNGNHSQFSKEVMAYCKCLVILNSREESLKTAFKDFVCRVILNSLLLGKLVLYPMIKILNKFWFSHKKLQSLPTVSSEESPAVLWFFIVQGGEEVSGGLLAWNSLCVWNNPNSVLQDFKFPFGFEVQEKRACHQDSPGRYMQQLHRTQYLKGFS